MGAGSDRLRLMIIDDDSQANELVREFLAPRYDIECSTDPERGLESALRSPPALLLLDIEMPKMSGFEVCETLRATQQGKDIPVLFLSSDSQASSMQRALKLGANDYITKPFRMQELLERVELRLGQAKIEAPLACGNLVLDAASRRATIRLPAKQKSIRISLRGFEILCFLIRNVGRTVTREQILANSSLEQGSSDRAVDLHIFRLRQRLKDWDHTIEAFYGRGYGVVPASQAKSKPKEPVARPQRGG